MLFFYFKLKDGSSEHTPKGLDCKSHLRTLLEGMCLKKTLLVIYVINTHIRYNFFVYA